MEANYTTTVGPFGSSAVRPPPCGSQAPSGRRVSRPVVIGCLRLGQRLRGLEAGRQGGAGPREHLVVLDVEEPQPALLAHGQRDEAAKLNQLRLGEVLVKPIPERVVGVQPPGDRLRVGEGGLLPVSQAL
jgi:hypothetical protein